MRVMITIKAASADEAKQKARGLANFVLDETANPIDMNDGTFVVFGTLNGTLDPSIQANVTCTME